MLTPLLGPAALLFGTTVGVAHAADHAEAPGSMADAAADIADFYAWHDTSKMVFILTYAGAGSAGTGLYDADVLYGIHVDTNGDGTADQDLWLQTGQNGAGEWGVRATLGSTTVEGPVATDNGDASLRVWAGLADDPFFFDIQGFQDTLSTGTVGFTGTDGFAGLNVMAFAVEVDLATITGGASEVQVWATTGRK